MISILTVCTGNICRSPAAAIALQEYLGDLATVSSAGVMAVVGGKMPMEMSLAMPAGFSGEGHAGRQLTPAIVQESDLIIAMTVEHRRRIVSENPLALKRTFLLEEIAMTARAGVPLAGGSPGERITHIAAAVQAHRPILAGQDIAEVPDPYKLSQDVYDEAAAMIVAACRDIAAWVKG
ncbi:low molecular weight phosphatase family protein [Demequina sp. NBRC 110054]|uniref:arsenate reductase/protein-tyrosine-phosphatase family protein n=1 Tax=Demequina sp. NBRC 110054 TaxID=1570343 RepID=UPI0013564A3F|nr:low molecular weight phosphatase family protein [Demequina sp. NBRC 110054]